MKQEIKVISVSACKTKAEIVIVDDCGSLTRHVRKIGNVWVDKYDNVYDVRGK